LWRSACPGRSSRALAPIAYKEGDLMTCEVADSAGIDVYVLVALPFTA